MQSINTAVLQLVSNESIDDNYNQIMGLLKECSSPSDLDLVCLPENSLYNKIKNSSSGLELNHPVIKKLQAWCDRYNVIINLGALPLKKNNKIYNSTVMLVPGKDPEAVYDKIHLFDICIGDLKVNESSQFTAGKNLRLQEYLTWNFAFSICYDLRFSELFLHYHQQKADIIFVPAAFTRHTGRAHWQTLIRARAIESQCYVIAPAQAGRATHEGVVRHSYGHSMLVDPWGKVLVEMGSDEPSISIISLSKDLISKTRMNMPIDSHRRL